MALVEGVKYGLSSQVNQSGNKTVIFVKLTDSALRAIDDYLKTQAKAGYRATLRFQGNEGNIHIPSSARESGHSFDFGLSTNSDIEGPQGSFECIQQNGARSLESAGPLSYKMRIKANDDVFVQTQHRFNELEQKSKQECAKEIKSNCADIGRKVKKKIGLSPLPQRREKSPSYISHHQQPKHPSAPNFANSSSNSQKLPNGYSNNNSLSSNANNNNSRKVVNGISNGNGNAPPSVNGSASKSVVNNSGSQDVSKRPLKERLIHMLAVKPYKKPELFQRLVCDGLKDRDRKVYMPILQQVANFKDNEYSLLRGVWNDVQEDWPFYSEQERQLMKRRKPQNLTPPGSDSSIGSGTSSLSPRSNSSIGSGHSPTSYSHSSNYHKPPVTTNGSSDGNLPPSEGNFEVSKGTKRPVNGILPEGVEDYGDIPHKKTRVSHFKRPGSGGSSNGNGANANPSSRSELVIKQDKDGFHGSSPQYSSQNNRIAERLSPIGTGGSSSNNFSVQNGSNGNGQLISNHRSPRNGNFEPMDTSPSPSYAGSNGYHNSSQGEAVLEESATVGSSWQSRNGNHDSNGLSDSEKPSRGDSADETDSIDSGNGSSTSGGSVGSQQTYNNNYSNNSSNGHPVNNIQGGYTNGNSCQGKPVLSVKPVVVKSESTSSSDHNPVNTSSNVTNGCNRVSSTTNFHNTPQSSPDSQVDNLQLQQQKRQSSSSINNNNSSVISSKHNHRTNGKANFEANANIDIIVTRDKGNDRDSYKDRERRRSDKEKDRDSRNKDRVKRNSDKRHSRIHENGDGHGLEKDDDSHPVKISSEYPSYITRYTTIATVEQRGKFKEDFNTEYPEYRKLHAVIDKVSKKFAHLEERLRKEERGTESYEKIKEQIVNEYYANKRDKKYQDTRQKFQYLHEKLSHIKRLVADYDATHQDQDVTNNEFSNGFLRNKTA